MKKGYWILFPFYIAGFTIGLIFEVMAYGAKYAEDLFNK